MRLVVVLLVAVIAAPAHAAPSRAIEFTSREAVLGWINGYRARADLARVPLAVKALSRMGAFRDPEGAAVYIGFIAGIIGANPRKAEDIVGNILPLPPEDQWVLVRAIAYSGLPEWKGLLQKFAGRMPMRQVMIEKYLAGKLPTLDQLVLERNVSLMDKVRGSPVVEYFAGKKASGEVVLEPSPEVLDTLWGYYFATGAYSPIARLIDMLAWAKDQDSVEKLTIGSMAKYTLASNAAHDPTLLAMLKWAAKTQPKEVATILAELIDAAETVELARLRKDALAAIDELKRKGPASKRNVSWWGQVGQGALAVGCIVAATTGHAEFGIPCVVGGGMSSAALQFWNSQP